MDGFSTFYIGDDGLVYKHKMDRVSSVAIYIQGDHLSGKPGNVREFETHQGNVREFANSQGINLVMEKGTKNWLSLLAYLHSYRNLVASS